MGNAVVEEFVGGYQDWLRQTIDRPSTVTTRTSTNNPKAEPVVVTIAQNKEKATNPKRKLSYNEQRELESLPKKIAALEQEQSTLQAKLDDATFHNKQAAQALITSQRLAVIDEELLELLDRWTVLES
jgi:ATP-binding cassette subfamily F protein uup